MGIILTDLSDKKSRKKVAAAIPGKLQSNIEELHLTTNPLEQVIHVISHDLKEPLEKASHLYFTGR